MPILKQRRQIFWILVAAPIYWWTSSWLDKPYCNIEHQDKDTIRGEKPLWRYVLSKTIAQRRKLEGVQDYAMYAYVHARSGIRYVYLSIDGYHYNLNVVPGTFSFTYEVEGVKTVGRHLYELRCMDGKGRKAYSKAYLTVTDGT